METQTPIQEGLVPTPAPGMSPQNSAPVADPQPTVAEAKPAEVLFAEEALGREFSSREEAQKALKNLNSMVGDQTLARQRKIVERVAQQSGLSTDELAEVLEQQTPTETVTEPVQTIQPTSASSESKRLTRLEVDEVVKNDPDAASIRDSIFAKSLATGLSAQEIWEKEYKPLVEVGRKSGAKKLQENLQGQPLRATSTASDMNNTTVDFSGLNPTTGKRWTAKEMEQYMGVLVPSQGL